MLHPSDSLATNTMTPSKTPFSATSASTQAPQLNSQLRIELLTHSEELKRPTNTGRLLLDTLPQARLHLWQRKSPPEALLALIADPKIQCLLLFPSPNAEPIEGFIKNAKKTNLPLHFIILDATWQQARKMYRQSPWLQALAHIELAIDKTSEYRLRRNQVKGAICTCEVGIALLKALGEADNETSLDQYFHQFMQDFQKQKNTCF
jgi:DTW domain-containing protein YfiP